MLGGREHPERAVTVERTLTVRCNGCGATLVTPHGSADAARDFANSHGWYDGRRSAFKSQDWCPTCMAPWTRPGGRADTPTAVPPRRRTSGAVPGRPDPLGAGRRTIPRPARRASFTGDMPRADPGRVDGE